MTKPDFVSLKVAAEKKIHGDDVSKVTSFAVAPHLLEIEEGFNARPLNPDHVAEMSLAMRNGATFPPLEVRVDDGHILIVDGHHRHAAALKAIAEGFEIRALDCRHFRGNDADRVAHMLNSASGLALTPLQLGVQYRKLIDFGWTEPQIANRRGKSGQHVKDMIQLAEADSDVHQAVNAGLISGTAALKMVKQHGSKAGAVIQEGLEQAKAEGKEKVTPKALARSSGPRKPADKFIVAWLIANAQPQGWPFPGETHRTYTMKFQVPNEVAHSDDLHTLLANAASYTTT
ncbi:ParB/RepB/Spo0J family partition protein [Massilia sp.]|uniref:ParB/RepB/Spo0J family partition protein n=1 Tax=Massilia sp. TaxID=1882437 RepID=UPI0028A1CCC3|nr:ParB N-terminal domain-containing protein [Massilia sp.]